MTPSSFYKKQKGLQVYGCERKGLIHATLNSVIDLKLFYPKDLSIADALDIDEKITIYMYSTSMSCTCHRCSVLLRKHHGSNHRIVQDLPILGDKTQESSERAITRNSSEAGGRSRFIRNYKKRNADRHSGGRSCPENIVKDLQTVPAKEYYDAYHALNERLDHIVTCGADIELYIIPTDNGDFGCCDVMENSYSRRIKKI